MDKDQINTSRFIAFWNLLNESVILVYNSRGNEENKKVGEGKG